MYIVFVHTSDFDCIVETVCEVEKQIELDRWKRISTID